MIPKDGRPIPLPLTPRSAAEALEDLLPAHAEASLDCGPVVAALVDRLEPGTLHPLAVPLPEPGMPIMGLADESLETEIVLDTWVGKGTVLLADGRYIIVALILELERRPGDDCWRARVRSREVRMPLMAYLDEVSPLAA